MERFCPNCHINTLEKGRRYCDNCRDTSFRKRRSNQVIRRRKKVIAMAKEYKGSKCAICGYSRCPEALEFHHINPDEKNFGISAGGHTKSWDTVKNEIEKCVLLCANCHREVEVGFTDLSPYL